MEFSYKFLSHPDKSKEALSFPEEITLLFFDCPARFFFLFIFHFSLFFLSLLGIWCFSRPLGKMKRESGENPVQYPLL